MARDPDRPRRETRQQARNAVDPKLAKTVLSEAAVEDVEPDDDAAEALREAAAEETADVAEAAAAVLAVAVARTSPPKTSHRRTNDIRIAKNVDGADNDRPQIRPRQVLPSD